MDKVGRVHVLNTKTYVDEDFPDNVVVKRLV